MDLLIGIQKAVFDLLDCDKPGPDGLVDQGRVGAPAEGIAVMTCGMLDHLSLSFQAADDLLVGIFDKASGIFGNLVCEKAIVVDRADELDSFPLAGVEVDLAEGGSRVDDTGPLFGRDLIVDNHAEGTLSGMVSKIGKERIVAQSCEIPPLKLSRWSYSLSFL